MGLITCQVASRANHDDLTGPDSSRTLGRVTEQFPPKDIQVHIRMEDSGGVWANFASVQHSPYEFTIDFARVDFNSDPAVGVVVSRVNLSPLFVQQLMEALQENWQKYAEKAMPKEVRDDGH